MRILFCNIASMNYYKGNSRGGDDPRGGGSFVDENHEGAEVFNFAPASINLENGEIVEICRGFVATKTSRSGKEQALHIEKIEGCQAGKAEAFIPGVLVIFCAPHPSYHYSHIVGWYRDAVVFRHYHWVPRQGKDVEWPYNILARKENCVLLPVKERSQKSLWYVPRRQTGASYGFGQANVWFAEGREENKLLDRFLTRIVNQIENYSGENWVDRSLESLVEEAENDSGGRRRRER